MKFCSLFFLAFLGILQEAFASNDASEHDNRQLLSSIINLADQIQNAVPTAPTTPMPTETPTHSSAPSPSPSSTPTLAPTVSQAPSISPTNFPTVSAQPTNFPTVSPAPSVSPSVPPTDLPSTSPTLNPTLSPTVSSAPSTSPSIQPTDVPSSSPTKNPTNRPSTSPSDVPSSAPSVSAAPSLMYYATLRGNHVIYLDMIEHNMNATQIEMFENTTKFFIQETMRDLEGAAVLATSVVLLSQTVESTDATGGDAPYNRLKIEIRVVAEYESLVHPDDFDFEKTLQQEFQVKAALYKSYLLGSGDPFFAPLDPTYSNDDGISQGGYIAVIVCSIVLSIIAIFASYYAIKRAKEENGKGDKLSEMNMYDDPVGSDLSQEDMGGPLKNSKSIEIIQVTESPEKENPDEDQVNRGTPQKSKKEEANHSNNKFVEVETIDGGGKNMPKKDTMRQQIMSPNTMETGRLGALAESILRSESFGSGRDPPESSRYPQGPKVSKGDPAANYRAAPYGVPRPDGVPPSLRGHSHPPRRDPSTSGASQFINGGGINSFFPKEPDQADAQPPAERARSAPGTHAESAGASRFDWPNNDDGHDVQLTVGRNGKLGSLARNDPSNSSPTSSAVSSSINAFLNMVGGTLGAAPLASPVVKQERKEEKNQTFHDVMQREGLYDVFAPSGALGIVVDTTKDGPAVHSLKQTSPMLGLINPGDLIVGLDSQDTRSMTAATLTRLMASKSNQKERKITLLAADNY